MSSDFPEQPLPIKPSMPEDQPMVPLHGWGRASSTRAHLAEIDSVADAVSVLRKASGGRGVVPRGLGRSYGDAAQNAGGTALDLTKLNRILHLNAESEPPTVTVQAGVSLDTLMRALLPFGLWVPVSPGTRQVTIGGAIAADVHGKNHHTQGSFGNHVRSVDLLTADGEVRTITPGGEAGMNEGGRLFWATMGGMGLTGVILGATVALQRAETAYFLVDTERCTDLDDLMTKMTDRDENYTYSVAWFDAVTKGRHLGRGVLTRGNKARRPDLSPKLAREPLQLVAPSLGTVPEIFPNRMVNIATARAFNAAWYRKAPKHRVGEVQNITQFFHPLDVVAEWNRIYGPHGFLQYQFVVPFTEAGIFRSCLEAIVKSGHLSCVNVLKRFGPGNPGPLSFPMPGWTMTVDLPIEDGLDKLCNSLDEMVIAAGGRVYLAKDSRLGAAAFRQMYPRLPEFLEVRRDVDPNGLFNSDLARRLRL